MLQILLSASILIFRIAKAVHRGYRKYKQRLDAYKEMQIEKLVKECRKARNPQEDDNGESLNDAASGSENGDAVDGDEGESDCMLCYGTLTFTTATPCGHLFCWSCIHTSVKIKPECPSCREFSPPQTLVLINNMP